ncbi:ABC transporter ATP-binding protein [Methanobrevibacter sp.]|jgi:lipopolysaccharide transport system ATP-binding protein|uniref:ABC transporter ATP-binding protein n=1 Tax=Methanobrevibacter sp. TaxID=66852 RepID=UPI0025D0B5A3|nr:ABC transporter ATP-binding protein [Methanobrevibacter sp.]
MDKKNNNLNFKKDIKFSSNDKISQLPINQHDKLKFKLMEKYNIPSQEAENIIEVIIKKEQRLVYNNSHNTLTNPSSSVNDDKNNDRVHHFDVDTDKKNFTEKNRNSKLIHKQTQNSQKNTQKIYKQIQNDKSLIKDTLENDKSNQNSNGFDYSKNGRESPKHLIEKPSEMDKKQNVDRIIEDIIPNYNQDFSIEVNHVDLTFEVANEKIDTLKESFIRTLKRNKSKKLKVHALKDISFKIYKGEKVGIIGYNGAGKSTLLSVITGIYPPDRGFVKTNGNISPMLSLGAGFDHNYSGRKNIFLNGAVLGYDKEFLESKVDEIIEFSELGEFIDIPIKNYSSGMLAKLGFSIATAVDPDILIIDEVLGVGDVSFNKKSKDKMKSLMDGGTTVLLVSHSIPQIRELCDKAIWIDKGEVREIGEVNKVCDHYLKDAEKASNEQLANIQFR